MPMRVGRFAALILPFVALSACSSSVVPSMQGNAVSQVRVASSPLTSGKFVVTVATATKQPIHISTEAAFDVGADNESTESYKRVVVRFGLNGLPINAQLCQVNGNGQCLEAPAASIEIPIGAKKTVDVAAFVTATGSIPHGTVSVDFLDGGTLLGSGKVKVTTKS
jgi:hypothetical protein